jgi:hypothetical protein
MALRPADRAGQIAPCCGGPGGWRSRVPATRGPKPRPAFPDLPPVFCSRHLGGRLRACRHAAGARRALNQEINAIASRQVQIFPRTSRIIRMRTISPMPPLGPYPQLLLCPHVGNTPTKAKIRMMRRIVPILICHLLENDPECRKAKPLRYYFAHRSICCPFGGVHSSPQPTARSWTLPYVTERTDPHS